MKLYTFINRYICGAQVGIQASHSNIEIMRKEAGDADLTEWMDNHKTFVWLDGGESEHMDLLLARLKQSDFLFAEFKEPGLGNVMTSVSVLLNTDQVMLVNQIRSDGLEYSGGALHAKYGEVYVDASLAKDALLLHYIANCRSKGI